MFKKNIIKPWQCDGWHIPPQQNAEFVANMEDVLDAYHTHDEYGRDGAKQYV